MIKFFAIIIIFISLFIDAVSDNINILFYPKDASQNFVEVKNDIKNKISKIDIIIDNTKITKCQDLNNKDFLNNDNEILKDFKNNCNLYNLLESSIFALHKKFIKSIKLKDIESWSSGLVLLENCKNETILSEFSNEYPTIKSLVEAKIINLQIVNGNYIIVENNNTGKIFNIKEITRCGFKNDSFENIVLEIKISDKITKKQECIIYSKYSKYKEGELINKKY